MADPIEQRIDILLQAEAQGRPLKPEHRQELDMYRRQGLAKPLADTGASPGKPLPVGAAKPYEDQIGIYAGLAGAGDSFQDDFAGNTLTGGMENRIQGAFGGFGTEGQRDWWANFTRNDNIIRNQLFGATLTPSEQAAYAGTTVNPGMDPKEVRRNLASRRDIVRKALARKTDFLKKNGYDPDAIDALAGEFATDLNGDGPTPVARLDDKQYMVELERLIRTGDRAAVDKFLMEQGAAATDPDKLDEAVRARSGIVPPPEEPPIGSPISAALIGGGDMLTGGYLDEAAAAIGAVVPNGQGSSIWQGKSFEDAYDLNLQQTEGYKKELAEDRPVATIAGQVGSLVGGQAALARAAPGLAARVLSGSKAAQAGKVAAVEGGYGAVYGSGSTNNNRAKGAAIGAVVAPVTSALGGSTVKATSRVLNPVVAPVIKRLRDSGLTMTMGQIAGQGGYAGRVVKWLEDAATSVPFVGTTIQGSRRHGVELLNRAAIDEGPLAPIGLKLPKDVDVGHDAVAFAQEAVGQAYEQALAPLRAPVDDGITTSMQSVTAKAAKLPQAQREAFETIAAQEINPFIPQDGVFTGEQVQTIKRSLDANIASYRRGSPSDEKLANLLEDARDDFMSFVRRADPENAAKYDAADAAYAGLVIVENAAAKGKGGVFSPEQFRVAIRQSDRSVRKRKTAAGGARMQGLSEDASQVLPSSIPDSGTAQRASAMAGLGLLAGIGGGSGYVAGGDTGSALTGAALLTAPYSPGGRRLIQNALIGERSPLVRRAGNALGRYAPVGSRLGMATSIGIIDP